MRTAGDVVSYLEMCQEEGQSPAGHELPPAWWRKRDSHEHPAGAPYVDHVEEGDAILVYEGHDRPRVRGGPDPKTLDQELQTPAGTPTQNGLFFEAARRAPEGRERAKLVRVYEKVRSGIWVFNGVFRLLDAWAEQIDGRRVFKFRLEIAADESAGKEVPEGVLEATRIIPDLGQARGMEA